MNNRAVAPIFSGVRRWLRLGLPHASRSPQPRLHRRASLTRFAVGLGLVLATLVAGYAAVRPFHLRWGATAAEAAQGMPGDLPGGRGWTRAITVQAPPEAIWPWLVQWGQGRGGWYSYDWIENLLGFDIHTATRIVPELQNPPLGEPICMARGFCPSKVSLIEPNRFFGWQAVDDAGRPVWTFTFGLFSVDNTRTRLVLREQFSPSFIPAPALLFLEVPDVVMEQKALATVRNRAEGRVDSPLLPVVEAAAWLAALGVGLAAGRLVLTRADWRPGLAVGLLAVVALLALTFLFPPLWLRAGLDAALIGSLIWASATPGPTAPAAAPQQA